MKRVGVGTYVITSADLTRTGQADDVRQSLKRGDRRIHGLVKRVQSADVTEHEVSRSPNPFHAAVPPEPVTEWIVP